MRSTSCLPLVLLLAVDLFLAWLLAVFRVQASRDPLEHRMLAAITVCGVLVVETLLCGAGCLLNRGLWRRCLYIVHWLALWLVLAAVPP